MLAPRSELECQAVLPRPLGRNQVNQHLVLLLVHLALHLGKQTVQPYLAQLRHSEPLSPFSSATTNNANKPESNPSFNFGNPSTPSSSTSGSTTNFNFGRTPSNSTTTPTTTPGLFSFKTPSTSPQSSPFGTSRSTSSTFLGNFSIDTDFCLRYLV